MAAADVKIRFSIFGDSIKPQLAKVLKETDKFARDMKRLGTDMTQVITAPLAGLAATAFKFSTQASAAFRRFAESSRQSLGRLGDAIARAIDLDSVLGKLSGWIDKAVTGFEGLNPRMQRFIVNLAALSAALGPVLLIGGKVLGILVKLAALMMGPWGIAIAAATALLVTGAAAMADYGEEAGTVIRNLHAVAEAEEKAAEAARKRREEAGSAPHITAHGIRDADGKLPSESREPLVTQEAFRQGLGLGPTPAQPTPIDLMGMIKQLELGSLMGNIGGAVNDAIDFASVKTTEFFDTFEMRAMEAGQFLNQQWTAHLERLKEPINNLRVHIEENAITLNQFITGSFDQISQGIGQAVAQIVVFGAEAGAVFKALGQQILATIISTLIQIGIQRLALAVLGVGATSAEIGGQMAGYASTTFAAAFSSTAAIPIIGPALAPAVAAASLAAMLAGAAGAAPLGAALGSGAVKAGAALGGAAEGGIFTRPHLISISEPGVGPEIALNKRNVREFLGADVAGGRHQVINLWLDRRLVARAAVRGFPEELDLHGITAG